MLSRRIPDALPDSHRGTKRNPKQTSETTTNSESNSKSCLFEKPCRFVCIRAGKRLANAHRHQTRCLGQLGMVTASRRHWKRLIPGVYPCFALVVSDLPVLPACFFLFFAGGNPRKKEGSGKASNSWPLHRASVFQRSIDHGKRHPEHGFHLSAGLLSADAPPCQNIPHGA